MGDLVFITRLKTLVVDIRRNQVRLRLPYSKNGSGLGWLPADQVVLLASGSRLCNGKAELLGLIESDFSPLCPATKPEGELEKDNILDPSTLTMVKEQPYVLEGSRNSEEHINGITTLCELLSVGVFKADGSGGRSADKFN